MRSGGSSKLTMATAGGEISGVESSAPVENYGSGAALNKPATMPHLDYTTTELDVVFPSIIPPSDEQLDDLVDDNADCVYQAGLRISAQISAETSAHGRRRRPIVASLQRPPGDASAARSRRSTPATPASGADRTTHHCNTPTAPHYNAPRGRRRTTTSSSSGTTGTATSARTFGATTTASPSARTPGTATSSTSAWTRTGTPGNFATSSEQPRRPSRRARPEPRPLAGGVRRKASLTRYFGLRPFVAAATPLSPP